MVEIMSIEDEKVTRGERFMGSPCKYGHDGLRYRSTGSCVHCALVAGAKQRKIKKQAPTLVPA